jgi:O-antigen biosynthesis protein
MVSSIQTPILMYHSVADRAPAGFGRFVVSPARFTQQMQLLRDSGYDGLSVRDYIRKSRDGSIKDRTVVLTFDDGFSDFGSAVLPVLAGLDFTATLYIVSGLVGKTSMWLPDSGGLLSLLDWTEVAMVASQGIEIGAHTMSHPRLDCLPRDAARDEITNSRLLIEDRLGLQVGSFAYPFGFRDQRIIGLVADAGYESACAVRYRTCSSNENVFDLPRHIVRGDMSIGEFERLARGEPQRLRQACDCTRSGLGALWRRATRKVGP